MAKQYKDKLAALKAIVSGKQSFDILRPPQHHVVCQMVRRGVKTYNIGQLQMSEEQYQQWYRENVREDLDTIIHFVEFRTYKDENEQVKNEQWDEDDFDKIVEAHENSKSKIVWNEVLQDDEDFTATVLEIHQEPIQPEKKEEAEIVQSKKETNVAPVLRPLSEHIRFNERIIQKLFS